MCWDIKCLWGFSQWQVRPSRFASLWPKFPPRWSGERWLGPQFLLVFCRVQKNRYWCHLGGLSSLQFVLQSPPLVSWLWVSPLQTLFQASSPGREQSLPCKFSAFSREVIYEDFHISQWGTWKPHWQSSQEESPDWVPLHTSVNDRNQRLWSIHASELSQEAIFIPSIFCSFDG